VDVVERRDNMYQDALEVYQGILNKGEPGNWNELYENCRKGLIA
jgi:hypothetical protein